jgi:hypothetical protein
MRLIAEIKVIKMNNKFSYGLFFSDFNYVCIFSFLSPYKFLNSLKAETMKNGNVENGGIVLH